MLGRICFIIIIFGPCWISSSCAYELLFKVRCMSDLPGWPSPSTSKMEFEEKENENFFGGFQQWDWIKASYIGFHVILTFLVPGLLYSIYWYERYSPDLQYRVVSNILLSHTCWIGIFRSIFARIPAVVFFTVGPFSFPICDVFYIFTRLCFVIFFNEIVIWQFIRFIYIVKGMKVTIVEDSLIAFYLTLCNIVLSVTFMIAVETFSFRVVDIDYHICTGVNVIKPFTALIK